MEEDIDKSALRTVYQDLAGLIGTEAMLQLYLDFRGMQITFPTHLYSSIKVKAMIRDGQVELSSRQLARKYGFSQRWINQCRKAGVENE